MNQALILLTLTLGLASATFGIKVGLVSGCIDHRIGTYGKPVLGPHRGPVVKFPVVRTPLVVFHQKKTH